MGRGRRLPLPRRRAGSKRSVVERELLQLVQRWRLGSTYLALLLAARLGPQYASVCNKQEVNLILRQNGYSLKKASPVLSLSCPEERQDFMRDLKLIWNRPDQVLFVDEKKFRGSDMHERFGSKGYALIGQRLPPSQHGTMTLLRPILPKSCEVIAAMGYIPHRALPLKDGTAGDVGLVSLRLVEGALEVDDILYWFLHELPQHVTPYPGRFSIIVMDNMPIHRKHQALIEAAINRRGGFVVWQSPQSPDVNLIEKLWDNTLDKSHWRLLQLVSGQLGAPRRFALGDLLHSLRNSRLSLHAYHKLRNAW